MKEIDWERVAAELDAFGWGVIPGLLAARDCEAAAALYERSIFNDAG
ncbi:hypothetical protein [Massilia varians]|nr:hypothetical protein [Massilia varians]MDK6075579.1 hypothetical protein [Massilia varians]